MAAIAFIAGIILAWPGFLMLAAHFSGDAIGRASFFKAISISALAIFLFLWGAQGLKMLPSGSGVFGSTSGYCGSGPTSYDC